MKPVLALRQDAREILNAAITVADPAKAVLRHLRFDGETVVVGRRHYGLKDYRKVIVVGSGKGSALMCRAVADLIGEWLYGGIIIVKYGYAVPMKKIGIIEAGHPIPDESGLLATEQVVSLLRQTTSEDLVINLISGGGSALLCSPADGISFRETGDHTTSVKLRRANRRNQRDQKAHLKGKRRPARQICLSIDADLVDLVRRRGGFDFSHRVGVPQRRIQARSLECQGILDRYGLRTERFGSITRLIDRGSAGEIEETPKPGDRIFEKVLNLVIGSNRLAVSAAKDEAESLGYDVKVIETSC